MEFTENTQEVTEETAGTDPESVSLQPEWKNPPKVTDLKQDYLDAQSSHDAQVGKINRWLDYLNVRGEALAKTPQGRSKHVPQLIRKQAEWRYAALSEPFLSTEDLFNVAPRSWEDKEAARQNEALLNYQFNTKIDKVRFIDEYVRTAVDEGTVIVRIGWEFEEEEVTRMEPIIKVFPDPASAPMHEQLHAMMQQNPQEFYATVPPEIQQAHEATMKTGIPHGAQIVGEQEVTEMQTVKNQPTLEICSHDNLTTDPSCEGDFKKAQFVVYSFESSMSELRKDGRYENLDKIQIENASILGEPDHSTEDSTHDFNFQDQPRKRFVAHEYWGYWDIDGTGIVKPIVATWVGETLIRLEENPFPDKGLPFVAVPYLPVRKSVYGEPDGSLLIENQKIAGAVTRGMIDILARSANGQVGMRKDAMDPINWRRFERGDNYQLNAGIDARQAVYMHTYPEIPASAQFMLGLQNNEAEALTGTKAFADGISGEALGNTAAAVRGALDAASKRELGILRRLAQGIVEIGRKIVSMNAVFLDEEEVVRVTNEDFVPVRRDDLMGNFDLKLSISTAEEDNAKAQELSFMLQTVGPNTDPKITYELMADVARLRKMPQLEKRLREYEPQPDPLQEAIKQKELELLDAKIQNELAQAEENRAEAFLDHARALVEKARAGDLQATADLKTLDFVEQESGVKQERDLQKQGAQAEAQTKMKILEAQLNQQKSPTK